MHDERERKFNFHTNHALKNGEDTKLLFSHENKITRIIKLISFYEPRNKFSSSFA
jgi:hypothetical protein